MGMFLAGLKVTSVMAASRTGLLSSMNQKRYLLKQRQQNRKESLEI